MRNTWMIVLVACLVLAACGSVRESRLNPVNWFGSSTTTSNDDQGVIVTEEGEIIEVNPLIGEKRQRRALGPKNNRINQSGRFNPFTEREEGPYTGTLVDQVTSLEVKRTTTGAIVTTTGLTTRQGAYDVRLVASNDGNPVDGVLTYELRAIQPIETLQGPERTRRIQAAAPLSVQDLESVRTVQVVARRNTRTSRR